MSRSPIAKTVFSDTSLRNNVVVLTKFSFLNFAEPEYISHILGWEAIWFGSQSDLYLSTAYQRKKRQLRGRSPKRATSDLRDDDKLPGCWPGVDANVL